MDTRILTASIFVFISLIIHIYPGNNKTSFWGQCTWRCLSIDLVINILGLLTIIVLGNFENKVLYLQYWSIYNLAYIVCFLIKIIQAKQMTERYLLSIQCMLYLGISGLLCI